MTDTEDKLARFRHVIREQTIALAELRAENERLQAIVAQSADAMVCLQTIFSDPSVKPEIRAAAAKAVLPFQVPKLSITGYANVSFLAQRLDDANRTRRSKLIEQRDPLVDQAPAEADPRPKPPAESDLHP